MNNSVYNISLDLHAVGSQLTLTAKAYDTARTIRCTLTENGKPYTISEGCYAAFTAKKPDGNVLFNATTVDDAINYEFTVNTVNAPGEVECEIRLYDGNGKLITSPRFTILVDDTVYHDGDVVESSSEFTALTDLMSSVIRVLGEVPSPVLYGMVQSLTDEQKALARDNIGAAGMDAIDEVIDAAAEAAHTADHASEAAARAMEAAQAAAEAVDVIPDWAKQPEMPVYNAYDIQFFNKSWPSRPMDVGEALNDLQANKLDKPKVLTWDRTVYPTLLDFLKTITVPGKYKFVDPIELTDCEYELVYSTADEHCYFGKLQWYASEATSTRMFIALDDISSLYEDEDLRPATMHDVNGKQDKLTAGGRISIDSNNVISAAEQVFIVTAVLDTTTMEISNASHTFAEIAAAYDAKKIVILRAGLYEFEASARNANVVQFTAPVGVNTYIETVRDSDVWIASSMKRVNEITDSATNLQYPSARAVVNYVNRVIGNVSAALSELDSFIGGDVQ